jgi:ribosomal-protein-alanine N-acetyltransferase
MFGPVLKGAHGVSLRTPTLDDQKMMGRWMLEPETSRFWGGRIMDVRDAAFEERHTKSADDPNSVDWTIAYEGESVGFTGLFHIDWVARDCESGIFIGRSDLYGRGIASEAVRLRTEFAWREMKLHRVHNWISLRNRGSRRANEKAGYRQMGLMKSYGFRSGQWYDDWLGEVFPPDGPTGIFVPPSKGG